MRWCNARAILEDFAIINWCVDPDRLRPHLPAGFEPEERSGKAFIAMVAFRSQGFHFRAAPFARISCGQADYRALVRHGEECGVWFFGGSLSSRLVNVANTLWKMPWRYTSIGITASSNGDTGHWNFDAIGDWGAATVALTRTGRPFVAPVDFGDSSESAAMLVDPLVGWYPRRDGGIGRYSVWHEPLQLGEAQVEVARCDVFERLGVIDSEQHPIGAGLQQRIQFDIHTPPTRVETGGHTRLLVTELVRPGERGRWGCAAPSWPDTPRKADRSPPSVSTTDPDPRHRQLFRRHIERSRRALESSRTDRRRD